MILISILYVYRVRHADFTERFRVCLFESLPVRSVSYPDLEYTHMCDQRTNRFDVEHWIVKISSINSNKNIYNYFIATNTYL